MFGLLEMLSEKSLLMKNAAIVDLKRSYDSTDVHNILNMVRLLRKALSDCQYSICMYITKKCVEKNDGALFNVKSNLRQYEI